MPACAKEASGELVVGQQGPAADEPGARRLIGDRLPTESELSKTIGVSRNSLREAVKALSVIRVLDVRQGDGTYATALEPEQLLESLAFVLDLHQDSSYVEILEIRRLLEPAAVEQACREGMASPQRRSGAPRPLSGPSPVSACSAAAARWEPTAAPITTPKQRPIGKANTKLSRRSRPKSSPDASPRLVPRAIPMPTNLLRLDSGVSGTGRSSRCSPSFTWWPGVMPHSSAREPPWHQN